MKLTRLFKSSLIMAALIALMSCTNDKPQNVGNDDQIPEGPNYSILDSRAVNSILNFEVPAENGAVKYWDDNNIDNAVMSPLSASMALSLVANGYTGESQASILKAFNITDSDLATLNSTMSEISKTLCHKINCSQIAIANSVWCHSFSLMEDRPKIEFDEAFMKNMNEYYDARVDTVDLWSANGAKILNKWFSDNTDGEITDFYVPDASKLLVIANATLFKADWAGPFDAASTTAQTFTNIDQSVSKTDFMKGKQEVVYAHHADGGEIVELKYKNENIRFEIYIPSSDKIGNLDFSTAFDITKLSDICSGTTMISMPKFELSSETDILPIINSMGVDLKPTDMRIIRTGDKYNELELLNFSQKVNIKVDEKGSKVAAATKAEFGYTAVLDRVPESITINRPFLFRIVAYKQTIAAGRIIRF